MAELARFTVRRGDQAALIAERPATLSVLSFLALLRLITREDDGGWLDVMVWRSHEEAARLVDTVPSCAAWFGHIETSSGLRHVEIVDSWPAFDPDVEMRS